MSSEPPPPPRPGLPGPVAAIGPAQALRPELMRFLPFSQMPPEQVDRWIAASRLAYFAPGEVLLSPAQGAVAELFWVRRGEVSGQRGPADSAGAFSLGAGDAFPVGALLGARPVTATYTAREDVMCLLTPATAVRALADECPALADFLTRRVQQFLALSQQALQAAYASQALSGQSLEAPLSNLARKTPLCVPPHTPLVDALRAMQQRRVGSVLVSGGAMAAGGGRAAEGEPAAPGPVAGILTRHDILERVTLAGVPLHRPIATVMSQPVQVLSERHTALDAALLMARQGIRHLPIVDDAGALVSIVSERDLFALQRLSLQHLGGALRSACDLPALVSLATDIRRYARQLLGQGVSSAQLTGFISHLNDTLTERWVTLVAARHGLDLSRACWLAFGSEGREEQTVSTDQDNGLIFEPDVPDVSNASGAPVTPGAAAADPVEAQRQRWLAMAREVNQGLAECGYPLCRGGIMASNPECCLTPAEWSDRFSGWMAHGAPDDLLKANIFFDLRAVTGRVELATALRAQWMREAAALPRFIKQMADNTLRNRIPLHWHGGIDTQRLAGREALDLKHQGSALFVDVARLYALARGLAATGTAQRLLQAGQALGVAAHEREAWVSAFEFVQALRLRVQLPSVEATTDLPDGAGPNTLFLDGLNDIDQRMLKESLRVARRLHQRVALDHGRL